MYTMLRAVAVLAVFYAREGFAKVRSTIQLDWRQVQAMDS
jgi:hypothetical protein